jgi:CRISPR-associated exonuclease Cas4
MEGDDDALPISALSHLLYCERRAALVHVVGVWIENEHTVSGRIVHERIERGEETSRPGLRVLRSVRVRSERLRLSGIIDTVEVHDDGRGQRFVPVETKHGPRRRWERDDVQLCAQAMALEEMTGAVVPEGSIFHSASKRRRVVLFTADLRDATARAAARLHAMFALREVPLPVADERCPPCSLFDACQPHGLLPAGSLAVHLRRAVE